LSWAQLSGADLLNANLEEANLRSTNMEGLHLQEAICHRACYDDHTRFTRGFDPHKAGMVHATRASNPTLFSRWGRRSRQP
jgi:uncharacterized protein YjbI with pentapeptide repeats